MIGRRLITVAIALPLLLASMWVGSWVWLGLICAIAAVGVHETMALFGRMELNASIAWAWGAAAAAMAATASAAFGVLPPTALGLGPLAAWIVAMIAFLLAPGDRPFRGFLGVVGAALYPAWLLGFLVLLRLGHHGLGTTFWLMAVVWVGDAAAYGAGSLVGGPHVVPGISPGKTLSGFVVGFVFAMAAAVALRSLPHLGFGAAAAISVVLVIASQFGDLAESLLKRRAGVKDSGTVLPGHGGVLDRFDGVLLAAPVLYYCLTLLRP